MNKQFRIIPLLALLVALLLPVTAGAQTSFSGGRIIASAFGNWSVTSPSTITAGAATITLSQCSVQAGGTSIMPWVANNHIFVSGGGNSETIAITSVSTAGPCTLTATFANSYSAGAYTISSGSKGIEEAMLAYPAGGIITVDSTFKGSTSTITGATLLTTSFLIEDTRGTAYALYRANGSGVPVAVLQSGVANLGAATVDLASVATAACSADSSDVTVTGAALNDAVIVTPATALQAGGFLVGRVTAANTARFQFCNLSGAGIDRASDTYTLRIVR
jgi:hypothetical protein